MHSNEKHLTCSEAADELTERARFRSLGMVMDPAAERMKGAALTLRAFGVLPCPESVIKEFNL